MPLLIPTNLSQQLSELREKNQVLEQKIDKLQKTMDSFRSESGIAIGKILEDQNIGKPVRDLIIRFYDEWFGTRYGDLGLSK